MATSIIVEKTRSAASIVCTTKVLEVLSVVEYYVNCLTASMNSPCKRH